MRLQPNKKSIAILSGGLILVILACGSVAWMQNNALGERQKVLQGKQAEWEEGQKIAKRRDEAKALLEEDRARLMFLEEQVTDAAFVPTLLKQMEDLALSTQNRVISVRPSIEVQAPTKIEQRRDPEAQAKGGESDADKKKEKKVEDPYTRLNIQVSLVGSYATTQKFVDRLMRFPKILAVEQFNLRPQVSNQPDDTGKLSVELKLTAFIMKQPVAPAKPTVTANAAAGGTL
jgi:Tfp pilus assembly protein PilO